jgi:hypothetical protein
MQIVVSDEVGAILRSLSTALDMTVDQLLRRFVGLERPPVPSTALASRATGNGSFRTRESSLPVGLRLRKVFKGQERLAAVGQDGIRVQGIDSLFLSPSLAAVAVTGYNTNGWAFWDYWDEKTRDWRPLDEVRQFKSGSTGGSGMGTQPKSQPGLFEQLKTALGDTPLSRDFLAEYVRELELQRGEEGIFIRLALGNASAGAAYSGTGPFVTSVVSELYEPLDADRKLEIRRWWHEKARRETSQIAGLRERLFKIA